MATLQELEQQEKELSDSESRLRSVASQPIPQRRFGFPVTAKTQQQVLQNRAEAQAMLSRVVEERQKIQQVKQQFISQQQEQFQRQQEINQYSRDIEIAKKAARERKPQILSTSRQREFYREFINRYESAREREAQISKLKAEGITPVIRDNQIVGFEDTTTRQSVDVKLLSIPVAEKLERLGYGVTTTSPTQSYTPKDIKTAFILSLKQDTIKKKATTFKNYVYDTKKEYDPDLLNKPYGVTGKVEQILSYPFNKAEQFDLYIRDITKHKDKTSTSKKVKSAEIVNLVDETGTLTGDKALTLVETDVKKQISGFGLLRDLYLFPITSARKLETYIREPQAREQFKILKTPEQKLLESVSIGTGVYAGFQYGKIIKAYLGEPIDIKIEGLKKPKFYSYTPIENVMQGSKRLDIAEFTVLSVREPTLSFQVSRGSKLLQSIRIKPTTPPEELSFNQLKLIYPKGKVVELDKLRATVSKMESSFIKGGRIQGSVRSGGKPAVFSAKISKSVLTGRTTVSGKTISKIEGEIKLDSKIIGSSRLDKETAKALQDLQKIQSPEGIEAEFVFPRKTKIQSGQVKITDVTKVVGDELKPIKYGKRTTRGSITAIQKKVESIKFDREFGLKEQERLLEKMAITDVTYPRKIYSKNINKEFPKLTERKPAKTTLIRGEVLRKEYNLPPIDDINDVQFLKPSGKKTKLTFQKQEQAYTQDTIQQSISAIAKKQEASFKPVSFKTAKPTQSKYYGTGLYDGAGQGMEFQTFTQQASPSTKPFYELSTQPSKPFYEISSKAFQLPAITPMEKLTPMMRQQPKGATKEITKEITKDLSKEIFKFTPKEITRELSKIAQKQTQKQATKQITKLIPRETITPRTPPRMPPRTPTTSRVPPYLKFSLPNLNKVSSSSEAYKTFVIKGGKKQYLEGLRPRGQALQFGESQALKTLRATFGVEPAGVKVRQKDVSFMPRTDIFRSYKIKKGAKVPLVDTFIQKRGKRLSSFGELEEIQRARRRWY